MQRVIPYLFVCSVLWLGCEPAPPEAPAELPECTAGGCSGQLCREPSELEGYSTACEVLPSYICDGLSRCGNYGDEGACGWERTSGFVQCLDLMSACEDDGDCQWEAYDCVSAAVGECGSQVRGYEACMATELADCGSTDRSEEGIPFQDRVGQ